MLLRRLVYYLGELKSRGKLKRQISSHFLAIRIPRLLSSKRRAAWRKHASERGFVCAIICACPFALASFALSRIIRKCAISRSRSKRPVSFPLGSRVIIAQRCGASGVVALRDTRRIRGDLPVRAGELQVHLVRSFLVTFRAPTSRVEMGDSAACAERRQANWRDNCADFESFHS